MARDVGSHLPEATDYVVIWGSMSPRTVGRYRPHITCVQRVDPNKGVSTTYDIHLESGKLPLQADKETYQRECYERLIGATCAAVPSCYAAYEISRERTPDLQKFYEFLGRDQNETKDFERALAPLMRWTQAVAAYKKDKNASLRRISDISSGNPFPPEIVNDQDGGVMRLITDETGKQPKRFPGATPDKDTIVYVDVLETTVSQYVRFLNDQGNQNPGRGPLDQDRSPPPQPRLLRRPPGPPPDLYADADHPGKFKANEKSKQCAVANVSWFGARSYCNWVGKELPSVAEWQAAAQSADGGPFPWGKDAFDPNAGLCNLNPNGNDRGGKCSRDCSRIGCFDMAGNVAEWCDDWCEAAQVNKSVWGGSFRDAATPALFKSDAKPRCLAPVAYQDWVGFRGVVRLQVDKANP